MKNILIIYPHWPPSNLAGVHRPRLISNFLKDFNWNPIILTVSSKYYEEEPDQNISRTVREGIEVIYTKAYQVTKPRLIGDIGLRALPFLYKEAIKLLHIRKIDFIWIPIPSFYSAILGRLLNEKTSIPYGIDYIDPWIRDINNRRNWRSRLSLFTAKWLEPIAVKKASLISGVSEDYYKPVLDRNFKNKFINHIGMPYGFDPLDHTIKLDGLKFPWEHIKGCKPLVYAGTFLPNSHLFIKALFKVIAQKVALNEWDKNTHIYFLGTGNYTGTSVTDYAIQYKIKSIVHEKRDRFPYLHILNFLASAYAVMAIGSTEKHYTASKIFQALLSKKPVFSLFHQKSSVVTILEDCNASDFLVKYNSSITVEQLEELISDKLNLLLLDNNKWKPDLEKLEVYSAKTSAEKLIVKLNEITN